MDLVIVDVYGDELRDWLLIHFGHWLMGSGVDRRCSLTGNSFTASSILVNRLVSRVICLEESKQPLFFARLANL